MKGQNLGETNYSEGTEKKDVKWLKIAAKERES